MEKSYPTDKLLIARPWVVVRDETALKMLAKSDILKLKKKLVPLKKETPKRMAQRMIDRAKESCEVHTVVLKQLSEPTVVIPGPLHYEDTLTSRKYYENISLSHNCEGDCVILSDETSGVDGSLCGFIEEIAQENEALLAFILSIKPTMTREEISAYMEIYKKINKPEEPKTLTLQNKSIFSED